MSWENRMRSSLQGVRSAAAESDNAPRVTLPTDALRPGLGQPRRHFDEAQMDALVASVRERGILQPLTVRPVERGYEIVAGERRWRAAQRVGLRDVPVYIRHLSDDEARAAALTENLVREDLSPLDEIEGKLLLVQGLLGTDDQAATILRLNQLDKAVAPGEEDQAAVVALEQVFSTLGKESWRSYTKAKLAVFGWHPDILDAMRQGLEFTKAKLIQGAPEDARADLLALATRGASRTELQAEIKRRQKPKKKALLREDRLRAALGKRRVITKMAPEKKTRFDELADELLALLEAE
ncbi:ParB/RepB/Spo0J family partition protein [Deinococcus wulumuqiensis]|uniref:ParB/RepB/Spo0J family partition protein n=1 Tax=Deinococcus wulumuqiensis TaxID=980427 RepID=UPI002430AB98|nr:ParB/RepB/Spo0J family partition protein [Deinococcus wulumuqiensis]